MACNERGGELLAVELPGRESRRAEPRYRTLSVAAEALFPVLAPKLNESVPYVVVGHSMGAALSRSPSRSALSLSPFLALSLSLCSLSLLSLSALSGFLALWAPKPEDSHARLPPGVRHVDAV